MGRITRTEFGSRLVQARKMAKLTQEQLCALVGIAQSTLSEAETIAIGSKHTAMLAEALGVSPLWLAAGQGPQKHEKQTDIFRGDISDLFAEATEDEPSPLARELSLLFDGLTDRIDRAQAYSAATQIILGVMQARGESDATPSAAPVPLAAPKIPQR